MRLDLALVERGLARSRSQARDLIDRGLVLVNGAVIRKVAQLVRMGDVVQTAGDHYVSRAAHELQGALRDSHTAVNGRVLDAGASTGGFTQVLLEAGATEVIAVDVGHGQLHATLRDDPRVGSLEGLHLRDLRLDHVGTPVDLLVADVSFISLTHLLEPMLAVVRSDGTALLLIKPQFEVGRGKLDSNGVVRSEAERLKAVAKVVEVAATLGWDCVWQGVSQLSGPAGNIEYFVKLRHSTHNDLPDH